jgi:WD40 repeat protein
LATGGGAADQCINFWNSLTGQSLHRVDTGSQVSNVAWSKDSPELVSFLHIKVVLGFVLEIVFLTKVKILFYIQSS